MKIIKTTIWYNPVPLKNAKGPRWDCEIQYENNERKRIINAQVDEILNILKGQIDSNNGKSGENENGN